MASPIIKNNIRNYQGVIDGTETVTDGIPCLSTRPMDLTAVDSTFGSGTLTVEHRPQGATAWFQWGTSSLAADGSVRFYPPTEGQIRLKLTGGTGYAIKWRYGVAVRD